MVPDLAEASAKLSAIRSCGCYVTSGRRTRLAAAKRTLTPMGLRHEQRELVHHHHEQHHTLPSAAMGRARVPEPAFRDGRDEPPTAHASGLSRPRSIPLYGFSVAAVSHSARYLLPFADHPPPSVRYGRPVVSGNRYVGVDRFPGDRITALGFWQQGQQGVHSSSVVPLADDGEGQG